MYVFTNISYVNFPDRKNHIEAIFNTFLSKYLNDYESHKLDTSVQITNILISESYNSLWVNQLYQTLRLFVSVLSVSFMETIIGITLKDESNSL